MKRNLMAWLALLVCTAAPRGFSADGDGASRIETRKREYASLQKGLEAAKPADDASKEELVAYMELAKSQYEDFAKSNPKTPEGFEAAYALAELMARFHHPDALKFAELGVESAPAAGVDLKRVAMCWVWVVGGRLEKQDADGALNAMEKIKPLSPELYDNVSPKVADLVKKINQDKDIAGKLKPGNDPFPIKTKDIKGKDFSLEDWRGKVVIIHFWAPGFVSELPNLAELYALSHARGLEIVGISLDQDAGEMKDAVRDNDITWTVLSDHKGWDSEFARKWGVMSLPRNYIIDRKGVIRFINVKDAELVNAVKKLINEDK